MNYKKEDYKIFLKKFFHEDPFYFTKEKVERV